MVRTKTSKTKSNKEKKTEKSKPDWLKLSDKDAETIIVKLAKQGMTSEKIGLHLRDSYGIPKMNLLGKKISKILKERQIEQDADIKNLENKQEKIRKHLEKNRQDKRASRALAILSQRVRSIKRYRERK